MSHWTKVKTTVKNTEYLRKALQRMGISFEEGNFTIKAEGKSAQAQMRLGTGNTMGMVKQEDGTWSMVGDPYYAGQELRKKYYRKGNRFAADVAVAYGIEETKAELESQQFFCTENEEAQIGADGKIRMVYTRYA